MKKNKFIISTLLLVAFQDLWACTLSVDPLNFGDYNPILNQSVSSQTNIYLNCANGTTYTISLDSGLNSSTNTQRKMKRGLGLFTINYNLYKTGSYNLIWGDGNGASPVYSTGNGSVKTHPVFGFIPAGQNVRVGSYSDTVTVRVDF